MPSSFVQLPEHLHAHRLITQAAEIATALNSDAMFRPEHGRDYALVHLWHRFTAELGACGVVYQLGGPTPVGAPAENCDGDYVTDLTRVEGYAGQEFEPLPTAQHDGWRSDAEVAAGVESIAREYGLIATR